MKPTFERRLTSLTIDSLFLLGCCVPLLLRFGGPFGHVPGPLWVSAASLLAFAFAIEAVSGITPGKAMTGLRVASEDGHAASIPTLAGRTAIKLVPFGLFVLGLAATSPATDVFWWSAAILVQIYTTIYYFAMARRDRSAFDLPVKTVIVSRAAA